MVLQVLLLMVGYCLESMNMVRLTACKASADNYELSVSPRHVLYSCHADSLHRGRNSKILPRHRTCVVPRFVLLSTALEYWYLTYIGPIARFGDTAANAGILALLQSNPYLKNLPSPIKTIFASLW